MEYVARFLVTIEDNTLAQYIDKYNDGQNLNRLTQIVLNAIAEDTIVSSDSTVQLELIEWEDES